MFKIGDKELNIKERYSLVIGSEVVTHSGVRLIENRYDVKLPPDFDLNWMSQKGGAFSKRLGKFLKKALKNNPETPFDETKFSALCAELKNRYCTIPKTHYFDVTDEFTWRAGAFKDGGSCYWNDPADEGYRATLTDLGGFAFRLFESQDALSRGLGRCWLVPILFSKDEAKTPLVYAAFNAYGPELRPQMEIFAKYLDLKIDSHNIYMSDPFSEGLYLNNGGNCLIIGKEEDLALFEEKNRINLTNLLYKFFCKLCSNGYSKKHEVVSHETGTYCKNCFNKLTVCPECKELVNKNTLVNLRDTVTHKRTRTICRKCNDERKKEKTKE